MIALDWGIFTSKGLTKLVDEDSETRVLAKKATQNKQGLAEAGLLVDPLPGTVPTYSTVREALAAGWIVVRPCLFGYLLKKCEYGRWMVGLVYNEK